MQAALQHLRQYRLLHHQVRLLQAEKNLAFLQCPTKVSELFGRGTGGTLLGVEVSLDGISTSATSIMFRAHLPERACKGHQASPGQGPAFAAERPPHAKEMKHYTNRQAKVGVTTTKQAQVSTGTK
jgi:hypothetical protein